MYASQLSPKTAAVALIDVYRALSRGKIREPTAAVVEEAEDGALQPYVSRESVSVLSSSGCSGGLILLARGLTPALLLLMLALAACARNLGLLIASTLFVSLSFHPAVLLLLLLCRLVVVVAVVVASAVITRRGTLCSDT